MTNLRITLLLSFMLFLPGCESMSYYWQAIKGHSSILLNQTPIHQVIDNPDTPETVKQRLRLVLEALAFADNTLQLPTDKHYLKYSDIGRSHVVWNVFAAPEFDVKPKQWCFLIVGCLSYRGYYDPTAAEAYAQTLSDQGLDTYVGGVDAYSTLGWFSDPVLSTFLKRSEASLVGLLFHELTHVRIYINGDSEFNESLATAVEHAGIERWFASKGDPTAAKRYLQRHPVRQQFIQHVQDLRKQLETLYARDMTNDEKRRLKAEIIQRSRHDFQQLTVQHPGLKAYQAWLDQPLNNAQLSTVATYHALVPHFKALLAHYDGDFERFYAACDALKKLSKAQRRNYLQRFNT